MLFPARSRSRVYIGDPTAAAHLSVDDLRFGSDAIGPVAISFEANHERCLASLDAGSSEKVEFRSRHASGERGLSLEERHGFYRSLPDAPAEIAFDSTNFPWPRSSRSSPRFSVDYVGPSTLICALPGVPMSRWLDGPFGVTPTPETRPSYLSCWDARIVRLDVQATADGSGTSTFLDSPERWDRVFHRPGFAGAARQHRRPRARRAPRGAPQGNPGDPGRSLLRNRVGRCDRRWSRGRWPASREPQSADLAPRASAAAHRKSREHGQQYGGDGVANHCQPRLLPPRWAEAPIPSTPTPRALC